jgi:hypothetical protein
MTVNPESEGVGTPSSKSQNCGNAGRPRVVDRANFQSRYETILECLRAGSISRRKAAIQLGIGHQTLNRLLAGTYPSPPFPTAL